MFLTESVATTALCVFMGVGADHVGVGVEEARREAHRLQVQVVVQDVERLVATLVVQVDERDLALRVLGGRPCV